MVYLAQQATGGAPAPLSSSGPAPPAQKAYLLLHSTSNCRPCKRVAGRAIFGRSPSQRSSSIN
eukprot:scaffold4738_cov61-Cyclotella_meneghiniana.AAC.3